MIHDGELRTVAPFSADKSSDSSLLTKSEEVRGRISSVTYRTVLYFSRGSGKKHRYSAGNVDEDSQRAMGGGERCSPRP